MRRLVDRSCEWVILDVYAGSTHSFYFRRMRRSVTIPTGLCFGLWWWGLVGWEVVNKSDILILIILRYGFGWYRRRFLNTGSTKMESLACFGPFQGIFEHLLSGNDG